MSSFALTGGVVIDAEGDIHDSIVCLEGERLAAVGRTDELFWLPKYGR